MPRKTLIRTSEFPYHVYSRSNNQEWFQLPMSVVWKIFIQNLEYVFNKFEVNSLCFVLMNNHYHLLIYKPLSNINEIMHNFNYRFALEFCLTANRKNRIFGGRYKRSLIKSEDQLERVYR